jgi:hypothetical protein
VQAYDAIVEDLRRTGATEENVRRVRLHTGPEDVFESMGLRWGCTADEFSRLIALERALWFGDSTLDPI